MSNSSLEAAMESQLLNRRTKSALRSLTTAPPTSTDFSSNDFLSLRQSPALRKAFLCELQNYPDFPLGSGGSRLLDGNSSYAESLERSIASFHSAPSGLLFNSGYDANAGFFACVPQSGDVVLYDEFIHASVREGMRLSRASKALSGPFRHNCISSLRRRIEGVKEAELEVRCGKRNVFVAVESLYSMDGDLAPLAEIVGVVEKTLEKGNGHVFVDEAHSTGIYGENGRGLVCNLGLEKRVFARLHTFGKALGCNGGNLYLPNPPTLLILPFFHPNLKPHSCLVLIFTSSFLSSSSKTFSLTQNPHHKAIILCNDLTRSYLINYARPLIYTTSMSFPSLATIRASYSLLMSGETEAVCPFLSLLSFPHFIFF
jgi:8-amino-7-oxononanoate synthase